MNVATVATCNLDQWALDFGGNLTRIRASIEEAKARGARFRLGPELEIPGYGCEDHFLERDTVRHSFEVLAELLADDLTDGILCDVGMPLMHRGVRYNARVFLLDRRVLLVRPKRELADDGNYREGRWFAAWRHARRTEPFTLPPIIRARTGQDTVPIGDAVVSTDDTVVASESCEELYAPHAPHVDLGLDGVEIFANGSGSHHELRKLETRLHRIRAATEGFGGVYLYANQQGCDGGRLYFDGGAMIVVNGGVVAQGSQFSPRDVEVITAEVDLDQVRSLRGARATRMRQASMAEPYPRVRTGLRLVDAARHRAATPPRALHTHRVEEEIALGPACWLWDYLRRSGAGGFFLALSGGSDSAAVATILGSMCRLLAREVAAGRRGVIHDLRAVLGLAAGEDPPDDPRALAGRLVTTAYLATKVSTDASRARARALAEQIGADHLEVTLDDAVASLADVSGTIAPPGTDAPSASGAKGAAGRTTWRCRTCRPAAAWWRPTCWRSASPACGACGARAWWSAPPTWTRP
ncbi:MAG: nitrilase-related carbon-nitrogen hydrolase [Trueperaceae bacterium]|nr:nitrilase-related carbon-nitrogen hydrolase [Trueperaceae bacterium]MDZ7799456.1 nitrilase-related carbon-nitrogen hydrolase [Trueperaceae bacterium]